MPAKKRKQSNAYENAEKMKSYERSKAPYDLIQSLMEEMSENNVEPDVLIPLNRRVEMMEEEIKNKSIVLMSPGHGGKSATVHWALRNCKKSKHVIWIDCAFWQAENAFVTTLLEEISCCLKQYLKKSIVINSNFSFKELSKEIKKGGLQLTIVLKNPEKLIDHHRPVILYNIFEWMNSGQSSQNLNFIILTREIRFIERLDKRVKSRMNIPIIYLPRPRAEKVIEILVKRIERCIRLYPKKENACLKLKKALEQRELEKLIDRQYEAKSQPISYYLKIMQLILAIGVQSQEVLQLLSQNKLNQLILEGFETYRMYIVDHRNIARCLFKISNLPEIILMGLYRGRFLRQKEGSYNATITLGQLMNDYNHKKRMIATQEVGNSFFYSQVVMENALNNLIDWGFLCFAHSNEKLSVINRQINSRYGPEEIQYLYRQVQELPEIVKSIYNDSI